MAVESQQGGDSYTHLGSQPDNDTLVDDIQKMSRIKRACVEQSLEPSGELRRSDSIRGSVFPGKSQSSKIGGTARIVTEVFRNNMLEYAQGILNGDPETESDDIDNPTVYDGNVTFTAADVIRIVNPADTVSTEDATNGEIGVAQPTTPGRLKITVTGATDGSEVVIVGKRRYGLDSKDLAPVTETVTLDGSAEATTVNFFHKIDKITFLHDHTVDMVAIPGHGLTAAANVEIIAETGLRSTLFKARSSIFTGWSMESQIGNESRIGLTVVPTSAQFNVSDTIRLSIDMLARAVYPRRTIEGGVFDEKLTNESDLVNDSFGDSEFFTDYGGYLLIYDVGATTEDKDAENKDLVIFDSFDLTYNPGLQYRTGKNGSRIQSGLERADAGATITGSIVVDFETGDDPADEFFKWDERFRDNVLSTIELCTFFWTDTGKEYFHRIKLPNVQLTANSETPVSSRGTIKRTLAIEAVVDNEEDVVEWEIADDHGWYGALPVITRTGAASVGNGASVTVTVTWTKDVRNFQNADVDVSVGTKGAFTKTSDSVYTSALTTPATGAGDMIFTIAENGTREGNPERSLVIPYA